MNILRIKNKEVLKLQEIWKDIKGYEGLYQISNFGRVKSLERYQQNHSKLQKIEEKIKTIHIKNNGYQFVQLYKDNIMKNLHVHRLVAQAFIPNLENKTQINHIDGNKLNNSVNNLEWVTSNENNKHKWDTGLQKPSEKQGKITKENNRRYKSKPINQLDLQGNYIKTWVNAYEASRQLGIDRSCISQCCNNGKNKTAGGYKWCFSE